LRIAKISKNVGFVNYDQTKNRQAMAAFLNALEGNYCFKASLRFLPALNFGTVTAGI
jgi:hypothetical protein